MLVRANELKEVKIVFTVATGYTKLNVPVIFVRYRMSLLYNAYTVYRTVRYINSDQ